MRRGGKLSFAAGLVALSMLAAACGGNDEAGGGGSSEAGGGGSSEDLSNLTGEVFISGSSTVEPISSLVAELFSEEAPNVEITVEGPGTGDGFELFCNGESDVSDASRPIEEEEIAACVRTKRLPPVPTTSPHRTTT